MCKQRSEKSIAAKLLAVDFMPCHTMSLKRLTQRFKCSAQIKMGKCTQAKLCTDRSECNERGPNTLISLPELLKRKNYVRSF